MTILAIRTHPLCWYFRDLSLEVEINSKEFLILEAIWKKKSSPKYFRARAQTYSSCADLLDFALEVVSV